MHSQLRPADILLMCWQDGKNLAVDVTVSHPAQTAEAPFTTERAKSFLKRKEEAKCVKYDTPCAKEGWDFTPMALDTWGGFGPKASRTLFHVANKCTAHLTPPARAAAQGELRQRLSLSLLRQVWIMLAPGSIFLD